MFYLFFYCLFPVIIISMLWTSVTFKISNNKILSSNKRESEASVPWPCWPNMLSPSCYTFACINLITYIVYTCRTGFMVVELLSPAVFSLVIMQVFHLIWCWVWLVSLRESLVFHLSWCEVTMVRIDVVIWAKDGMVEMVITVMAYGCPNLLWIES
jgi:hypothetical protein